MLNMQAKEICYTIIMALFCHTSAIQETEKEKMQEKYTLCGREINQFSHWYTKKTSIDPCVDFSPPPVLAESKEKKGKLDV